MSISFDNTGFFKWLWNRKVFIIVAQIIAFAASIAITMPYFMPPEYRSSAIVYPYNLSSYSKESSSEQLMQFLTSVDIKNDVIKDFGLIKHYKIDTTEKYWYTTLLNEYDEKVEIGSTEYEAVEIKVRDVSPDTAYKMVNDIIKVLNGKVLETQVEKSKETERLFKTQVDVKKRQMDSLSALSRMLSVQYGLLDDGNQVREVERAYYQMLTTAKTGKPYEEVAAQVKNMEEKGEQLKEVNEHLTAAVKDYDEEYVKYQEAVRDVNKQVTYINTVAKAFLPDKKVYPIRWIYTLLICSSVFIFSIILLRLLGKKEGSV
jgi:capsular polysaccharide biosynthesis protein